MESILIFFVIDTSHTHGEICVNPWHYERRLRRPQHGPSRLPYQSDGLGLEHILFIFLLLIKS